MDDSIAHPKGASAVWDISPWRGYLSTIAAVLLALLFIVSGVWKITDPYGAAMRMAQAKVPASLSLAAALGFGIAETFTGVLLLVPRFRRWGAWLAGLMLLAFMVYMAIFYNTLRGEDCSCFPWLKRVVGPGFFISDGLMLVLAYLAGGWARASSGLRTALTILCAIAVFAGASYGFHAFRQTGIKAPAAVTVDGRPFSLQEGRVFLYFFDPECSHCDAAARRMATLNWENTKIVGVATAQPQFGKAFMDDTGLKAPLTTDLQLLRKTFLFGDAPYAVALEYGRQKRAFSQFEGDEVVNGLREIGFVK